MKVRFIDSAQPEFAEAIAYYNKIDPDLGERFKGEVDRYILKISQQPEHYRLRDGIYRRVDLEDFPYYVPFVVRGDILWVLAVAHSSREPRYWIDRWIQIDS